MKDMKELAAAGMAHAELDEEGAPPLGAKMQKAKRVVVRITAKLMPEKDGTIPKGLIREIESESKRLMSRTSFLSDIDAELLVNGDDYWNDEMYKKEK